MEVIANKEKKQTASFQKTADVIEAELNWCSAVVENLSLINGGTPEEYDSIYDIIPPELSHSRSVYSDFILKHNFGFEERLVLILSLVPHLRPELLDLFKSERPVTSFGGAGQGKNHHGFVPNGETVLFILAGNDMSKRLKLLELFDKKHVFYFDNIVSLSEANGTEPELSGALIPSQDFVDLVTLGEIRKPDLRPDFPAKLLTTGMEWDDMILPANTLHHLNEIERWIQFNQKLREDSLFGKKIKPGFRALFYGPPGTGKTLSASLVGKKTGRDVYRVDLSTIVSKYIGETEKNLARLFDRASRKEWILFFDEADALFGKRTNVNDSHDRYANQEVSYLLQRIEYHDGLVILATNLKNNIDSAFLRRFQSIVYFPMPRPEERLLLWQKAFSDEIPFAGNVSLDEIARKYELSGSLILNIVSHCTLRALDEDSDVITMSMLQDGIARELAKEGKTI
ncbi:MAG: ATP-binding protein [Bacteroidia bacterium]